MDVDPDPRTVRRVSVERPVPTPADCVPPGEQIATAVSLSDGWLAVTPREVLVYRTDRDPPLVTVPRPNVTGVAIRRSGDGPVIRYAPRVAAYGFVGILVGLLFGALVPAAAVEIPRDSPAANTFGFIDTFTAGLQLVGDLAVLLGAVAFVGALGALGYRLATGARVFLIRVAGSESVQCRAAGGNDRRALRQIRDALDGPFGARSAEGVDTDDAEHGGSADAGSDTDPGTPTASPPDLPPDSDGDTGD
jgi:hypothetical protein